MTESRPRFPASVYERGTEPDPRFSLANERTFLAWIRTGIALTAGGLAVDALHLPLSAGLHRAVGVGLAVLGVLATCHAWRNWVRTERALRENIGLPGSGLKLPATVLLGLLCVLVVIGLVT
jgi:putative membrane protein